LKRPVTRSFRTVSRPVFQESGRGITGRGVGANTEKPQMAKGAGPGYSSPRCMARNKVETKGRFLLRAGKEGKGFKGGGAAGKKARTLTVLQPGLYAKKKQQKPPDLYRQRRRQKMVSEKGLKVTENSVDLGFTSEEERSGWKTGP